MNDIQVYDIAAGTWFAINATGDVPKPRTNFCSALAAAPDDSSFQLIIYGGNDSDDRFGGSGPPYMSDVYMLVLPAFQWVKVNTNSPTNSSSTGAEPRSNQFCTTYHDRQFVVLGGTNNFDNVSCDSNLPALKMLDLTTFEWQTQYPLQDTTYKLPQAVIDIVGGDPDGGAKPAST